MSNIKPNNIKPFDELTITDDFMFGTVMSDPKNLKPLLEYILDIKIARITYPKQHKVIDLPYDAKCVRLDAYREDDSNTIYSIVIQVADLNNLSTRIRYCHSMIDSSIICSGDDFRSLKKSFVIMLCCSDPFGKGRYSYTFKHSDKEEPDLLLDDDETTILLNIQGTVGEISSELKAFFDYMAGDEPAEGYTQDLDNAVKKVKTDKKLMRDYMTLAIKTENM